MSLLTQIQQRVNQLTAWANEIRANSKRTDELPDATNGAKLVPVWNASANSGAGQTQKITRDALVDQNNIGKLIKLGYFTTNNPLIEFKDKVNLASYVIGEKETPVIFTAQRFVAEENNMIKLAAIFLPGKGSWGAGGTPVTVDMFYLMPNEALTPGDIDESPGTEIIALGQLANQAAFLPAANSAERDFTVPNKFYYFSYYILQNAGTPQEQNVLYFALFRGAPGMYGGSNPTQLQATDFAAITNSTVVSGANVPDATTTIKGKLRLAGDLAGTADAPTVPGLTTLNNNKLNKGANSEYTTPADSVNFNRVMGFSKVGAVVKSTFAYFDEVLKKFVFEGTIGLLEPNPNVLDGNFGFKLIVNAAVGLKIFDDTGNLVTWGVESGKRLMTIHTAFRQRKGSFRNETEFIQVPALTTDTSVLIKTFSIAANSILTIDAANIAIINSDKNYIRGRAQFSFRHDGTTITDVSENALRYGQQFTTIGATGNVTNALARVDAVINGTSIELRFYNSSPGRLTGVHVETKHTNVIIPEA